MIEWLLPIERCGLRRAAGLIISWVSLLLLSCFVNNATKHRENRKKSQSRQTPVVENRETTNSISRMISMASNVEFLKKQSAERLS